MIDAESGIDFRLYIDNNIKNNDGYNNIKNNDDNNNIKNNDDNNNIKNNDAEYLFKITITPIIILSFIILINLNLFISCVFLTIINYVIDYIIWYYKSFIKIDTNAAVSINLIFYAYIILMHQTHNDKLRIQYIILLILFTIKMIFIINEKINFIIIPYDVLVISTNWIFFIMIFTLFILYIFTF